MKRDHNEDSFFLPESERLAIVADGMGGHASGEVASRMAVETIAGFFKATQDEQQLTWPFKIDRGHRYDVNRMVTAIKLANLKIHEQAQSDRAATAWGPPSSSTLFLDGALIVGHVGDSRLYRFREGAFEQLTEDHSLLNDYIKMKHLSARRDRGVPAQERDRARPGDEGHGAGRRASSTQPRAGRRLPALLGRAVGDGQGRGDRGDRRQRARPGRRVRAADRRPPTATAASTTSPSSRSASSRRDRPPVHDHVLDVATAPPIVTPRARARRRRMRAPDGTSRARAHDDVRAHLGAGRDHRPRLDAHRPDACAPPGRPARRRRPRQRPGRIAEQPRLTQQRQVAGQVTLGGRVLGEVAGRRGARGSSRRPAAPGCTRRGSRRRQIGRRRSSSAGASTWTPVNICSRTALRAAAASARRGCRPRARSRRRIAPQRRGSGSSRSSMVAAPPAACAARAPATSTSATTLAFITSTGPRPNSGRALAIPPPGPEKLGSRPSRGSQRRSPWPAASPSAAAPVAAVEHVDHRRAARRPGRPRAAEADGRVAADRNQRLRQGQSRAHRAASTGRRPAASRWRCRHAGIGRSRGMSATP